ncbi:MAG: NADP-dependent phosphogluconate dehydrogenase, partial [Gammaproteobacteria bacterium]|nr:NADP-dependent phosphogluconate dehydrogenase [Gammaproteobacteria bacterium]
MTDKPQCEIGMIGLGTMGRNLLLNMADHGFSVAGYDRAPVQVKNLRQEAQGHDVHDATDIPTFIGLLRRPRAIMLLIPAGPAVDEVIKELLPYLEPGDLIIDGGNSYFKDTDIRARNLSKQSIQFLGVGISGGEEGARRGPSIMPGGSKEAYQRVQKLFEAIAAKVNNEPCVAYIGPESAGHYVKMVHNGIEYAMMQLIAETYDVMKRGLGLNNTQLCDIYSQWNKGELNSYLLEITSHIFGRIDEKSHKNLIDEILGIARQTGTGMWTSQSGMELQVPIPTIDLAVGMRDLSVFITEREQASNIYQRPLPQFTADNETFLAQLQQALFAAMIIAYAQGMALLKVASDKYEYGLNLESVSRIWRGGCI